MSRRTFDSEIGDVHERRGDRPSFTNEFQGASASLIEGDRPPRILDAGRRGRRLMRGIILLFAVLIGGGWAVWYWSAPLGEWIAGLGRAAEDNTAEPAEPEPEPEPAVESEPGQPSEPEKVFGIRGSPDDPAPTPAPETTPPETPEPTTPEPTTPEPATPSAVSTNIQTTATQVRGQVSNAAVTNRLAPVDAALPTCWAEAIKAGATASVDLELSFQIRWSGRANSVAVTGGSEALNKCVRAAVPGSGWPKPRDGGDAKVTRRWTLGG